MPDLFQRDQIRATVHTMSRKLQRHESIYPHGKPCGICGETIHTTEATICDRCIRQRWNEHREFNDDWN